ncbi:MAG: ABC transporter ATP-binding protein [Zetaproteobacteria bacterium]|nr:ABC transporter ATP-binding protein [Zetaproteobacteria bacterium]
MSEPLGSNARLMVRDLVKSYPSTSGTLEVLQGLSFEIFAGEFVAIVGESGCGKSTLLQILGTLDRADSGEVRLESISLLNISPQQQAEVRNQKIGFVYQAHHLIPELSAIENVMLPLLIQGLSEKEASPHATTLLQRLRLGDRLHHLPAKLSGGEAQRVAVARALISKPLLLLADEPTGNLDEATAAQVFDEMRSLCHQEQAAVVMVTHSMSLAKSCDRMFHLQGGHLRIL